MTDIELYLYKTAFTKLIGVAEERVDEYVSLNGVASLVENALPILETDEQINNWHSFKTIYNMSNILKNNRKDLNNPDAVGAYFASLISDFQKEHFIAVFLNSKGEPVGHEIVSVGTLNSSLVHPREVFKKAILHGAASIIVGHNHPSGNVRPSPEDVQVTNRLKEVGQLIGISVLDHVVFEELGKAFSFREEGIFESTASYYINKISEDEIEMEF